MGLCVVGLLAGATLPTTADAQEMTQKQKDAKAKVLFDQASTDYSTGRYADALAGFEEALELSGRPELYYNIGLTHDRMRNDAKAVEAYRAFVEARPQSPQRAEVQARIESIEGKLSKQQAEEREKAQREKELQAKLLQAQKDKEEAEKKGGSKTGLWLGLGGAALAVVAAVVIILVVVNSGTEDYQQGDFGGVTFTLGKR